MDDETGLMYYGARYYDPDIGRFITPDAIVPDSNNPQAFNRYSYGGNNPVSFLEDGNGFWFVAAIIGAIVGGAAAGISAYQNGGNVFKAIAVGAISGAILGGTGGALGAAVVAESIGMGTAIAGMAITGAAVGAGSSAALGGNAGYGALIGGLGGGLGFGLGGAFTSGFTTNLFAGGLGAAAITGAVAGGVGAELHGGSFGSGAGTGAAYAAGSFVAGYGLAKGYANRVAKSANKAERLVWQLENLKDSFEFPGSTAEINTGSNDVQLARNYAQQSRYDFANAIGELPAHAMQYMDIGARMNYQAQLNSLRVQLSFQVPLNSMRMYSIYADVQSGNIVQYLEAGKSGLFNNLGKTVFKTAVIRVCGGNPTCEGQRLWYTKP